MKKLLINPFTVLLVLAFTSVACSSRFSGFDKSETGLYYKLYKVGTDTAKAQVGDFVTLDMKYTTENDSVLFDSKAAGMAQPIRFQLPPSEFNGDLYEGLAMMAPGDSAEFLIHADSLFTRTFKMPTRPAFIDSNSYVKFFVTMVAAETMEEMAAREQEILQEYLQKEGITVQPLESGLYYIETQKGTGRPMAEGDRVKMHFTLSLANGNEVFSSYTRGEPLSMEVGKPFDTPGFDEGIGYMTKGGKARLIVPSEIAFGAAGRGAVVPPYSTLVYDVEAVDVMSKADFEKQEAA